MKCKLVEMLPGKVGTVKVGLILEQISMDLYDYGQLVFSEKIHENMWVVKNEAYRKKFVQEGAVDPVFTWDEVELLKGKGITPEAMKKIWLVRKIFPESEIEEISQQEGA